MKSLGGLMSMLERENKMVVYIAQNVAINIKGIFCLFWKRYTLLWKSTNVLSSCCYINSLCKHLNILLGLTESINTKGRVMLHPFLLERPRILTDVTVSHMHCPRLTSNGNGIKDVAFIRVRDCNKFRLPRRSPSLGWKTFTVVTVEVTFSNTRCCVLLSTRNDLVGRLGVPCSFCFPFSCYITTRCCGFLYLLDVFKEAWIALSRVALSPRSST